MRYKKKGITVISVTIILVVMAILVGVVTISTNYILEDTYKREFDREYKLVKAATEDYIMRNSGVIDFEEIEFDISSIEATQSEQFEGETIVNNIIEMYVIDLEKIGVDNATYGIKLNDDNTDVYLLSKGTNAVYYMKGFEHDDNIYYKGIND